MTSTLFPLNFDNVKYSILNARWCTERKDNNGTFVRYDSIHTVASEQGDGVNEPFWVTRTFCTFRAVSLL